MAGTPLPSEGTQRPVPFRGDDGAAWMILERCEQCGRHSFPPMGYGCEGCGAAPASLTRVEAPAEARIVASSVVYFAPGSDLRVPATIAMLELSEPDVRFEGVLDGDALPSSARVRGMVIDGDGESGPQLRFVEVAG